MMHAHLIEQIAQLVGVADRHQDHTGRIVETPLESKAAVLEGLGLPAGNEGEAIESLEQVQSIRKRALPPVVAIRSGQPTVLTVRGVAADLAFWHIGEETGETREGRTALHHASDGARLGLPALPIGYHRLRVTVGSRSIETTLIAAPPRCFQPDALRDDARLWGTTAQIYALRSKQNFGIGDYTDLGNVAAGTGRLGASFLGLSPVHALFSTDRTKISPYSPSSRLFLETLFIDPLTMEGFAESDAARLLEQAADQLENLRSGPLVDYEAVWTLKLRLLDALWSNVQGTDLSDFRAFRRQGGAALEAHAIFEALSEHFLAEGRHWRGEWPAEFKTAGAPGVRAFRQSHPERVAFHAWLQWLAHRQLGQAAELARLAGMSIGLYRDLAVGADAGGSEVWTHPERFALGLSVGAPPDPFGPEGQNWGLPPFHPLRLEEEGLGAFRSLVAANMRHAGAIRIDHAFQLQRQYLIPAGMPAASGAYVSYPFEAMLAVLKVESHRARCLVIAEDLGTGPAGFSDAIMESGLLSYRVLWFEHEPDGSFARPRAYPRSSLATVTTHDLPTFRGWWRGLDIDLRQSLGLCDQADADAERAARALEMIRFNEALAAEGLAQADNFDAEPSLDAAVRYLARTRSALVALQLEDAVGELNQANLPGPDRGYPNWRRKLAADVETIVAPGGDLAKLAAGLAVEGRGAQPHIGALAAPSPRATYRLQFNRDFTFDHGAAIVPYLARLGISHVYASPVQTARPGSTHGYDIVDHDSINPELGGEDGFRRLSEALRENGLGLVLDVVPNHMGIGGADNAWWLSVLEWGQASPFEGAFDIDWDRLGANGKLVVPFLGDGYGTSLEQGELKLAYEARDGSFSVWHWEHRFPVCPLSYPIVLDRALAALQEWDAQEIGELLALSERLRAMSEDAGLDRRMILLDECESLKARLARIVSSSEVVRQAVDRALALVNGVPGNPESFGTLHRILEAQSYRLAYWRVAASDINYRRFFDINELAGLRVEDPEVFGGTHALILRLIQEGLIQGLRIDHIDGLADPGGYLQALQDAAGPGFYIVVEKILTSGERLRPWPVAGTTGYEALNLLDGVFVETAAAGRMRDLFRTTTGIEGRPDALLRGAKAEILESSFASELEVLVSDLKRLADRDRHTRDYTAFAIRRALVEIIAHFPVYRSYLTDGEPAPEDRSLIEETIEAAKRSTVLPDVTVHDFAAGALLSDLSSPPPASSEPDLIRRFRRRFQQLTGPVMAKGLEDTLFYRYMPLLSLNEVGGDPGRFGVSVREFHRANLERSRLAPNSLIATATHDTKRGEDFRLRLHALSELPDDWAEILELWKDLTSTSPADGVEVPDAGERYLILQSILGAWPVALLGSNAEDGTLAGFGERIEAYVVKALREAKRHTSWVRQNERYESMAIAFIRDLLASHGSFLTAFRPFARRLAYLGMLSSLSRTVLKGTVPGVPDFYQGTETWDLSLVDPDNRRPVDYERRNTELSSSEPIGELFGQWTDGRIKQRLIRHLLADRAASPELYAFGDYQPLTVTGPRSAHVLAFMRSFSDERLVVVVPRLFSALVPDEHAPLAHVWEGTRIEILAGEWRNTLTDASVTLGAGGCAAADLFDVLPVAVLRARS
jgi:(1->4)-alpha-D-glucan 1-alpha-D-glucosylmutase